MVPCMLVLRVTFLLSSEFPTSDVYDEYDAMMTMVSQSPRSICDEPVSVLSTVCSAPASRCVMQISSYMNGKEGDINITKIAFIHM